MPGLPRHSADRQNPDATDPVCGMTVVPSTAAGHFDYDGRTYYFCSTGCLERFRANPEQFVNPRVAPSDKKPAPSDVDYTCPMHPEIRQKGPGSCPICGMALEPVTVTLEEQANEELEDMTRRFRWSLLLTLPMLAF